MGHDCPDKKRFLRKKIISKCLHLILTTCKVPEEWPMRSRYLLVHVIHMVPSPGPSDPWSNQIARGPGQPLPSLVVGRALKSWQVKKQADLHDGDAKGWILLDDDTRSA